MLRRAASARAVNVAGVRHNSDKVVIKYTYTDEAPALATHALLPVLRRFCDPQNIQLDLSDISLASRIKCQFGLDNDNLTALGDIAKTADGYIIKLPNVSASIPQLVEAIKEMQAQGLKLPDFPAEPKNAEEEAIRAKYAKALGSAVNPVLREGNSDRRAAAPVKSYAQKNRLPVKVQPWEKSSKSHVAAMESGDFYGSEQSYVTPKATTVRIEFTSASGETKVLKAETKLLEAETIDASRMSAKDLRNFFEKQFQDAKEKDVMVSLHLKATMMKVSDPIMFGHAVSVFFRSAFEKHAETLKKIGANPNNGLASVLDKIKAIPEASQRDQILADFDACYAERPRVAMVDSAKGITNFHVPSDVIIDASMPPMVRDGGKMWNKDDKLEDTKALIPDRCYAGVYQTVVEDCKANGQFDHTTMGHVSNVGLMAKAAEEYGSHDKTFEIPSDGVVKVVDTADGKVIFEHQVGQGDIWRMCQTKDIAVRDWVKLAYTRALASNTPAIFWLDENRPHDKNMIEKIKVYEQEFAGEAKAKGIEVSIMKPAEACQVSVTRARAGKDTISVTGNVLRDYNTDLFPIIELGTSAKMLSIVPLLAGGGMYETGAGGSAPKHVQQFLQEGHLRWDSLGEYLAMAACLEDIGARRQQPQVAQMGAALNKAIQGYLDNNKAPGRKVKELDNRLSHYYVALYWAEALSSLDLAGNFGALHKRLAAIEAQVTEEMVNGCQGAKVDVGGYYHVDKAKTDAAMRPSAAFNKALEEL